jgi:hypothetical protein
MLRRSIVINVGRLPPDITSSRRAVLWNYEERDGKSTKVPYVPSRPHQRAAVDDPSTWGCFSDAVAAVFDGKADGAGIVLGDGLVGVDIDGCRNPETGLVDETATSIVQLLSSYTEISPSGRGVHILARGLLPPGGRRKGSIEMYCDGRYFTVTGRHLDGTPGSIEDRTAQLAALHARIFGTNGHQTPRPPTPGLGLDDAELVEKATAATNGATFAALWAGNTSVHRGDHSAADLALCSLLAFWTNADPAQIDRLFRQSGLMREKWDSRRGRQTYGELTIAKAVASCSRTYAAPERRQQDDKKPPPEADPSSNFDVSDDTGVSREVGVSLDDLYAYMPMHQYIFSPSRELWPASSVNARLERVNVLDDAGRPKLDEKGKPIMQRASAWLDRCHAVEQMTWIPGRPMLIRDHLVSDGGWIPRRGCTTFNLYRPPHIEPGDADLALPWLAHINTVYPDTDDSEHIVAWLAHRVQRPHEKINHAIVFGGAQGIGKDCILEPVKAAVGPWNFAEISPAALLGRFNGFAKSVILRISEARDLGDVDRYAFYDHLKIYTAAPPDVLRVDEKNLREYVVWNVCGVVITTNYKTDGLYLPPDDRRHYVTWSCRTKDDFPASYWNQLWGWYATGGARHVAAYLAAYDLSGFNAKAPPPKTAAFWDIVDASRAPEDAELADALDKLQNPPAVTIGMLTGTDVPVAFKEWLRDRKNARQIPHRMESVGYVRVRNDAANDGLWVVDKRRQAVYARHELSLGDQRVEAERLRDGMDR